MLEERATEARRGCAVAAHPQKPGRKSQPGSALAPTVQRWFQQCVGVYLTQVRVPTVRRRFAPLHRYRQSSRTNPLRALRHRGCHGVIGSLIADPQPFHVIPMSSHASTRQNRLTSRKPERRRINQIAAGITGCTPIKRLRFPLALACRRSRQSRCANAAAHEVSLKPGSSRRRETPTGPIQGDDPS
jgi:hypothetical protein